MRKILILLLFSTIISINSNSIKEIEKIIKCLSKSYLLKSAFEKILRAINSKDISNIIKTGITLFNEFKDEINQCKKHELEELSNKHREEFEDIRLGYPRAVYVLYTQIGENAFKWFDDGGISNLKEQCHLNYGQRAWFCEYLME